MAEYQFTTDEGTRSSTQNKTRYLVYILLVLVATIASLSASLFAGNFEDVLDTMAKADWRFVLIVFGIMAFSFLVEGLIYLVFCRLYTRNYQFHKGLACSLIGEFYNDVTPGSTSGRIMSAYTLKSQGIAFSHAASIMVMWFILNQVALIIFGIFSIAFEWEFFTSLRPSIHFFGFTIEPPMWPLIALGFVVNIFFIGLLLVMSYSKTLHNFILYPVISFLAKIHIVRNPDDVRESLRIQVENFKMELRRLQSNIPVLVLLLILFLFKLLLRYSLPYFCGMAMHAFGEEQPFVFFSFNREIPSLMRATLLTSFHQMVTGLIPLPGSAGVSELFYSLIFRPFFGASFEIAAASQILWRTATFYSVLLITGIFTAFYRSRGNITVIPLSRKTYVTVQLETYEDRRASFDSMYETSETLRRAKHARFVSSNKGGSSKELYRTTRALDVGSVKPLSPKESKKQAAAARKAEKKRMKKKTSDQWDVWNL